MKRIFTLLVSALMCAGLYAQTTPTVFYDAPASSNVDEIVFTEAVSTDNLAEDAAFSANGFIATISDAGNKICIDANDCRFGTPENYVMYHFRMKSGGASSSTKNFITFTIPSDGKLIIAARTGSNSATDRHLIIKQDDTELYNEIIQESMAVEATEDTSKVRVYPYVEVNVKAGQALLTYTAGMNFYRFAFEKADQVSIKAVCEEQKAKTVKMMQNGKLIIKKNGKTFNALGVEVR